MTASAGWYPQADGQLRYWDGELWTEHFAPAVPALTGQTGIGGGSTALRIAARGVRSSDGLGWFGRLRARRQNRGRECGAGTAFGARVEGSAGAQKVLISHGTVRSTPPTAPTRRKFSKPTLMRDYALPLGQGRSVVGESYYQSALHAAAGGRSARMNGANWADAIKVLARLIPEPNNKFDHNAVAVEVDGRKVGYIPRERAGELQRVLLAVRGQSMVATCPGFISGGGNRSYGIFLRYAEPETIQFFLNSPKHVYPVAATRSVTVTGEERHQDFLSTFGGDPAKGHLASLHPSLVAKGKYAGEFTAEVRIDDSTVGSLTGSMGQRYKPLMALAERAGQVVGCIGFVTTESKGLQVTLLLPSVEELEAMVSAEMTGGNRN